MSESKTCKVVIVGGGFAGLACWQILRKSKLNIALTLIDKRAYFEYTPALHIAIVDPGYDDRLRISFASMLKERFAQDLVQEIKQAYVEGSSGNKYPYDFLVLATGSRTNFYNNKSFEDHGLPCKSLADVARIREKLREVRTVTVVGGGYTGVELAASLANETDKHVKLVHSRERLLHNLSERVSGICENYLKKAGVEIYLGSRAKRMKTGAVSLADGREFETEMIIMSSGVVPETPKLYTALEVNDNLKLKASKKVYAGGDVAPSKTLTTAHNAIIEGRYVARQILSRIDGRQTIKSEQKRNWRLMAIALGKKDGIVTLGENGVYVPELVGLAKKFVEVSVVQSFKRNVMLFF